MSFALAAAGALSIGAAIAPQAQAQTACYGKLCVYEHANYGGRYVAYATGSSNMAVYGPYFNDMTSSVRNNTASTWCGYANANYGGGVLFRVGPYQALSYVGSWANDRVSSVRRC